MTATLTQEEADDIFDTLQADIEAASAKEAELEVVLTRLEELILEDILSGDYSEDSYGSHSGSVTPSTAAVTPAASEFGISLRGGDERQENFIQQKSLALLPLLCRFPLFTSNGSDRLIKLIVLVSKRLNPKELWLGLDSVVETSRVGLESLTDGIDDAPALNDEAPLDGQSNDGDAYSLELVHDTPEHLSIYLSRALLAIQIVIPRIRVKKPDKYLKPVLDALTGCFTALQSVELREQIVELELFAASLLLINTSKLVSDTWAWAQARQAPPDNSLKSALTRLYLLAVRSLLPLCPEMSKLYSSSPEDTSVALNFGRLVAEPCTSLNIQPLDELKTCRDDTHRGCKDTSEWRNHVQRTVSYVLLAPLFHNGMQITEEQSQTILHNLPGVINVIMEEDLDELLRAVALQAAICLGEAALRMPPTKQENKPRNGTTSSLYSSIRDVLITLADYARDIEKRPPLSPTQPAPARRMLDFCERLLLDSRLEVTDRDRLIIMLLEDETLWIKTLAVNVLRKLTVTESQGQPSALIDSLLPTFGPNLFTWRPMHAGYMHDLDIQAFAICLLNFIYVFNVRRGVRAASEDSTIACFLRDISELLIAANEPGQTGAKKILEQQDASTQTASQLQLEVVKDAWRRAADSARANET